MIDDAIRAHLREKPRPFPCFCCLLFLALAATVTAKAEQFGQFTYRVIGDTIEITDFPIDATGGGDPRRDR